VDTLSINGQLPLIKRKECLVQQSLQCNQTTSVFENDSWIIYYMKLMSEVNAMI
jgi:hypothetical protein